MPHSLIPRSLPLLFGFLLTVLIPASTLAIPGLLNQQGHILDSTGVPMTGSADVTFALYNTPTEGSAQWSQTLGVTFDNGFYAVVLGSESSPLDTDLFDGSDLFLGITLDGQAEFIPRDKITAVPYTFRAGSVEGEVKAVGGLVVDGVEVVNDQQQWVGLGISFTDLADVPEDWADGDDVGLEGSGTAGTFTEFTESGVGDSGMIEMDGKVGVGVSDPQSTFHIAGGLQLEDDTGDCVSGKEGTLRWHENALEVCDGTEWANVSLEVEEEILPWPENMRFENCNFDNWTVEGAGWLSTTDTWFGNSNDGQACWAGSWQGGEPNTGVITSVPFTITKGLIVYDVAGFSCSTCGNREGDCGHGKVEIIDAHTGDVLLDEYNMCNDCWSDRSFDTSGLMGRQVQIRATDNMSSNGCNWLAVDGFQHLDP